MGAVPTRTATRKPPARRARNGSAGPRPARSQRNSPRAGATEYCGLARLPGVLLRPLPSVPAPSAAGRPPPRTTAQVPVPHDIALVSPSFWKLLLRKSFAGLENVDFRGRKRVGSRDEHPSPARFGGEGSDGLYRGRNNSASALRRSAQ